ncbi:MAG: DUF87 domain-containing protein [Chloroflexota bacterium]|nr:MAG: DUF87 domain-containing protein [Chloroflexota bacterium]
MKLPNFFSHRGIILGTHGLPFPRRLLSLTVEQIKTHAHVIGVSGSGKSRFLAGLFLSMLENGLPATLIDPHGDLARLVLAHLVRKGVYRDPKAHERIIYLDLPAAEQNARFIPYNVLAQHQQPHTTASNVKEAMHRAWPALAAGAAPMFDTLVQDGVKVLISNRMPITALYRLLTDTRYRDSLLAQEEDQDVVSFFRDQFDRLSSRDQADQAGAALRRAHLMTFSPVLKYSLGQAESILNFRNILDQGQSLIVNLALPDTEARRLLGCLLTVSAEQGALSRAELPAGQRFGTHHLILDEFSEFTAQSEEALSRMLSLTRKYGLHLVLAHQTWSQTSARLRGALQNVGLEVVFRLGREDAEYSATMLGRVDPLQVKHQVADESAVERTHPVFYSLAEQWERFTQELQELRPRHAYVCLYSPKRRALPLRLLLKSRSRAVTKVRTPSIPDPEVDEVTLQRVEQTYLELYFRPKHEIEKEMSKYRNTHTNAQLRRKVALK